MMAALSLWGHSALAAPTSAASRRSVKKWIAGSAMRTHLLKNRAASRQLLAIRRQAAQKKPGLPLARAIQQLAAASPKVDKALLAWAIAADIGIMRTGQARESDRSAEFMKEMASAIEMIMEAKGKATAAVMRMLKQLSTATSKLEQSAASKG